MRGLSQVVVLLFGGISQYFPGEVDPFDRLFAATKIWMVLLGLLSVGALDF